MFQSEASVASSTLSVTLPSTIPITTNSTASGSASVGTRRLLQRIVAKMPPPPARNTKAVMTPWNEEISRVMMSDMGNEELGWAAGGRLRWQWEEREGDGKSDLVLLQTQIPLFGLRLIIILE